MSFHLFHLDSPDGAYVNIHNQDGAHLASVWSVDHAERLLRDMDIPLARCWKDQSLIPDIRIIEHGRGITAADFFGLEASSAPPRGGQISLFTSVAA